LGNILHHTHQIVYQDNFQIPGYFHFLLGELLAVKFTRSLHLGKIPIRNDIPNITKKDIPCFAGLKIRRAPASRRLLVQLQRQKQWLRERHALIPIQG
jgi:hypothetical protein